jgi:hypothetical protein
LVQLPLRTNFKRESVSNIIHIHFRLDDTIKYMRAAGIKVWVLTGDKVETAINIGHSSGLLDNSMRQFLVTSSDSL